jgi:T4-like virus tail tube protein gp19
VSGIEADVAVVDYRLGNDKAPGPRKLPGEAHFTDIVLKRGLTSSGVPSAERMASILASLEPACVGRRNPPRRVFHVKSMSSGTNPRWHWLSRTAICAAIGGRRFSARQRTPNLRRQRAAVSRRIGIRIVRTVPEFVQGLDNLGTVASSHFDVRM